jgi:hypothetical protein
MRYPRKDTPSVDQVEGLAAEILQSSLSLVRQGYKCTSHVLLMVLFCAASRTTSIHDACRQLSLAPRDQTIRNALSAWMPLMPELERRLNHALQARLPRGLRQWARPMAIDLSETCYYGQPWEHPKELRRGKRREGTSRFHCYATLYVVHHGERFTVAMTYVWATDKMVDVVRRLLEHARAKGLKTRYLLLDRGFYGIDVVEHLKSIRTPFLMPVVHRGRKSKKPLSQLKGTRRFLAFKRSGWSTHLMANRKTSTKVNICVFCRPKVKPMVFAYWGFHPPSPAWVGQTYRTRYGIEASYRQMNQARARTCSRKPQLRLLLVGIALVLRNVWVWLHHAVLGQVRGRHIQLHLERLRFRTMLLMLQHYAEATLGCQDNAELPLPPPLTATTGR